MNDSQALARTISCLLDNATPDSTWSDFQVEWNPIITALTCKLLLSCGLLLETDWFVEMQGVFRRCRLRDSLHWLNNAIRPDGTFGTDFWDAAQLAILIESWQLANYFSAYLTLKRYLDTEIATNAFEQSDSQWQGPGFCAAAIEYLRASGQIALANSLCDRLVAMQNPDGHWRGHCDVTGTPVVSPVWHTSQCAIALSGNQKYAANVNSSLSWLRKTQHATGAWVSVQQFNIYFTAYAVMALLLAEDDDNTALRNGIEFLKRQIGADGKCSDLGGTLMCGLAIRAAVGANFDRDITFIDVLMARKNLTRASALQQQLTASQAKIAALEQQVQRFEKKYGDADIVFTKKQAFLFAIVAFLLTAIGTVVGVYGMNTIWPRSSNPPALTQPSASDKPSPSDAPMPPGSVGAKPSGRSSRPDHKGK